jgi:hypothetical protein
LARSQGKFCDLLHIQAKFLGGLSIERELGNDQRCLVDATRLERLAQRWPVTALAALDFGELTNELPATAFQIIENGGLLRFETEAAGTLLCCCCPIPEARTRAGVFLV